MAVTRASFLKQTNKQTRMDTNRHKSTNNTPREISCLSTTLDYHVLFSKELSSTTQPIFDSSEDQQCWQTLVKTPQALVGQKLQKLQKKTTI